MNVISVIIYAAELALAAIILFYVVEMLTMPANMKRVSRSDCSGRHFVGDWSTAWLCSATCITCGTVIAELTEQPQHHPVKKPFVRRRPHLP
jgi:hypothetical protein